MNTSTKLISRNWKHRWTAMLLMLCLLLPTFCLPASAMSTSTGWNALSQMDSMSVYPSKITLYVEAGQTFYLGDYIIQQNGTTYKITYGSKLNISYQSNKTSVASVNKTTGLVSAKKAGTATLTATYKGKKYTCTLKVQKKGALKSATTYAKLNKYAKTLAAYYGKTFSSANIGAALKALLNYEKESAVRKFENLRFKAPTKLYVPLAGRCTQVKANIEAYVMKECPLEEYGVYPLKSAWGIKSGKVNVSANTITLTLKKKITKTQIYAMQYLINRGKYVYNMKKWPAYSASQATVTFANYPYIGYEKPLDEYFSDTAELTAIATFKANSNQVTLKLYTEEGKRFRITQGSTFTFNKEIWGTSKVIK